MRIAPQYLPVVSLIVSFIKKLKISSLTLLLCFSVGVRAEVTISPSDVFSQVVQVDKEVELIMNAQGVQGNHLEKHYPVKLLPRHVWQKSYFIFVKINSFRRKKGLPVNNINSMEPVLEMDPNAPYEQTQRLLTELNIIKKRLGIEAEVTKLEKFVGKKPVDVFNRFQKISLNLDILNREDINPALVFAEVIRIYEDINTILRLRKLQDTTFPPEKLADVTPGDSLKAAFELMQEVQKLQVNIGLSTTDFSPFLNKGDEAALPADVFNMVGMVLAELQPVKARMNLKYSITPAAKFYTEKSPADVHQLLRWLKRKINLIHRL
ncbi:MAG: hypothetical protein HOM14_01590 [Gammaproteobacteria bacterium]|jgi:hypothetical protein|nr:hypothetical protein [Gammaproteobacteria bacterium]MBT3724265.1 hypothetical protein [Gammaproteobacteria bacterium]MBT4076539.1 hypothetical protein [Gammaproteobacteria bacterium]MBT4449211.1 hypothetical protein [Gammaproteobacteria bacterium]MBT4859468.1 hypothetical protein [Gammaproteobacteria bacterium]